MHLIVEKRAQRDRIVGEIREIGSDALFARIVDASVGSDPKVWMDACQGSGRVVVRCADPIRADASDSDDQRLVASWSQSGWARFDQDLEAADALARSRGVELMIRPSSAGMLSDAVCTLSWARRSESLACRLLLDPIGWLVPSMLGDIEDHLTRIAELCQSCPKVGAVLIRSVRTTSSCTLEEVPIGAGEIDPDLIVDRLGGLVRSARAIVVLEQADLDRFTL